MVPIYKCPRDRANDPGAWRRDKAARRPPQANADWRPEPSRCNTEARMTDEPTPAIIYAAKSTEDKHGSIPTQLGDCRRTAEAEGQNVEAEYSDEAASGYSGNRGPELARALDHAERIGAELWVQHSDRLARGDGDRAQHLVELVLRSRKSGVRLRSVQDPQTFDTTGLVYAALMGDRNFEDSARKSAATRAGLQRRKDKGKPVGPVPLGYTVESNVIEDKMTTRRVIDPATVATVERIFTLVEAGATFGDVARTLNAEGITTRPRGNRPGGTWVARTVRKIVHNRAYCGEKGYPEVIDPERFDAIHANLARLDPVRVAKRCGGRKSADESYFLRGIARCGQCGASLYTRRQAVGRVYVCANRRQGTGLCNAPVIPAELIESHVLRHLDSFIGSVEGWIASRLADRDSERQTREAALDRSRAHLRTLDGQRERHMAEYRKLVDQGATTASIALSEVERIDAERAEQERLIAEREAVVREWSGPPDVNAALDYYNRLVDQVHGRIEQAKGAEELNDALGTVVAGLWAEVEEDRDRLLVEFELVGQPERCLPDGQPVMFDRRPTLPPRMLDDATEMELLNVKGAVASRQTGTQTFV